MKSLVVSIVSLVIGLLTVTLGFVKLMGAGVVVSRGVK